MKQDDQTTSPNYKEDKYKGLQSPRDGYLTKKGGEKTPGKDITKIESDRMHQEKMSSTGDISVFSSEEVNNRAQEPSRLAGFFMKEAYQKDEDNVEIDIKRYAKVEKIPGGMLED